MSTHLISTHSSAASENTAGAVLGPLESLGLEMGLAPGLEMGLAPGLEMGLVPGLEMGLAPGLEMGLAPLQLRTSTRG